MLANGCSPLAQQGPKPIAPKRRCYATAAATSLHNHSQIFDQAFYLVYGSHFGQMLSCRNTYGYRNPGSSLLCTERLQVLFLDTEIVHTIKSLTMTKLHTHFEFDSMSFWYKLRWKDKRKRQKCIIFQNNKFRFVHKGEQSTSWRCTIRLCKAMIWMVTYWKRPLHTTTWIKFLTYNLML